MVNISLLNFFTGGKSNEASDALKRAEDYYGSIETPSVRQLTLPELQKYVEMGVMTPAEAQAYLQQNNAYDDQNIDQTGTGAQIQALDRLRQISDAGAMGTPTQQAAMDTAEQNMNRSVGGQRGAIEQAMAARGTPASLIQAALSNQTVGQDAQQAHMDAVNAQSANYQTALNAVAQGGQLGGQLQGQQNAQANTVAQAANAMQQFNAQNQNQNAQFNAANKQQANLYNTQNKQEIGNQNTQLANSRTAYNANLPQQDFNNKMSKAGGMAGAATNYGNLQQNQGQQNAGLWAGLINTATSFVPKPGGAGAVPTDPNKTQGFAHGGMIDGKPCYDDGGMIPGESNFPGDTVMNDTVDIKASPGEAVIPRSSVQQNPEAVESLLQGDTEVVDVQDAALLLKALRAIRTGAV